ncbi:MAG: DNA-3-methyladenine glycosylase family protein [Spirochaetota bacterium]
MISSNPQRPRHDPPPPPYWERACAELSEADATLAALIAEHQTDVLHGSGDAFRTLVNAIVGQQISVAAAAGIWGRLTAAYPELDPRSLASAQVEDLRSVGLSGPKAEYVRGVAHAFAEGRVDAASWHTRADEEIRAELTALRGVGPWTADMLLIFHARRPDVLPLGDIGLVNAAARLYGWEHADALSARRERLADHAERWRPWRTVATWFIWRDLDAEPVIY